MSDLEREEEFDKRIKSLDLIGRLAWWVLASSFALGVWVANLQVAVSNNAYNGLDREIRIRVLETNVTTMSERMSTSLRILEKMEKKLDP